MRLLRLLFILVIVLMAITLPTFAEDGIVPVEVLNEVWFARTLQIGALLGAALLGGGTGYIVRAVSEARDVRFMALLESQYNNSNQAMKQLVLTLESAARYLAVSIPMTEAMRRSFLTVADFVDEVSDGVPVADKTLDVASPGDPGESPPQSS